MKGATRCAASAEDDDSVEVAAPELATVTAAGKGKGKGKGIESAAIEEPNNHPPIPPVPFPVPRGPQK